MRVLGIAVGAAACAPASPAPAGGGGAAAGVEAVPGTGDLSAVLFDEDDLPHFELTIDDENWAILAAETEADRYHWVEATFTWEGEEIGPVGVRTKGENSWQSVLGKPSLKVDFDRYLDGARFRGLKGLTLDAMNDDASMMHERVAYRLYREAGVPAARATHATLTINGEDYGLYTHVETVDRVMMGRWFSDDGGPLFEQHDVDWYAGQTDLFELEYGPEDRTALEGLAAALDADDPAEALAAAEDWLDLDEFLLYWAVGAWVAQLDAYPYTLDDCHVFWDGERLVYLPHGVDETFYYPDYNVRDYAGARLAATCLRDPDCAARWRERLDEVTDVAAAADLLGYAETVADQVRPLAEADPRTDHAPAAIRYYQQAMLDMIAARPDQLAAQLGR